MVCLGLVGVRLEIVDQETGRRLLGGVGAVEAEKQVRPQAIDVDGPLLERQSLVALAGEHDVELFVLAQFRLERLGQDQVDIFLEGAVRRARSVVVAAVAGVDDDHLAIGRLSEHRERGQPCRRHDRQAAERRGRGVCCGGRQADDRCGWHAGLLSCKGGL